MRKIHGARWMSVLWLLTGCTLFQDQSSSSDRNASNLPAAYCSACTTIAAGETLVPGEPCPLGSIALVQGTKVWKLEAADANLLGQSGTQVQDDPQYVLDGAGFIQGVSLTEDTWQGVGSVRIYAVDHTIEGIPALALISWRPEEPPTFVQVDAELPSLVSTPTSIGSDNEQRSAVTTTSKTAIYALKRNEDGLLQLRMIDDNNPSGTAVGIFGQYGSLALTSPWIQFMRQTQLRAHVNISGYWLAWDVKRERSHGVLRIDHRGAQLSGINCAANLDAADAAQVDNFWYALQCQGDGHFAHDGTFKPDTGEITLGFVGNQPFSYSGALPRNFKIDEGDADIYSGSSFELQRISADGQHNDQFRFYRMPQCKVFEVFEDEFAPNACYDNPDLCGQV